MSRIRSGLPILIADDDAEDRMLARDALMESHLANPLYFVTNGEELLDYLRHRGAYARPESSPRPGVILLDLKMPRMSGLEALAEIKADPELRGIPVVVLTSSRAPDDISRSYDLGVNSFITKPVTFVGLVEAMKVFSSYWFELVTVPDDSNGGQDERAAHPSPPHRG